MQPDETNNLDTDYGSYLISSGWSQSAPIHFLNCALDHISILDTHKYRATMSRTVGGKRFAITYDFGEEILRAILQIVPKHILRLIENGIKRKAEEPSSIITVEFNELIPVGGFAAHLGSLENAPLEDFVPLIVEGLITNSNSSVNKEDSSRISGVRYFAQIPSSIAGFKEIGGETISWVQAPEFIKEADSQLGLSGELIEYYMSKPSDFEKIKMVEEEERESFFSKLAREELWRTYTEKGHSGIHYTVLVEYRDRSRAVLASEETKKEIFSEWTRLLTEYINKNPSANSDSIMRYSFRVILTEIMYKYGIPLRKMGFFYEHLKELISPFEKGS